VRDAHVLGLRAVDRDERLHQDGAARIRRLAFDHHLDVRHESRHREMIEAFWFVSIVRL